MEAVGTYIRNHRAGSVAAAVVVVALVVVCAYFGVRADHGAALAECRQSVAAVGTARAAGRKAGAQGARLARDAARPGYLTDRTLLKTVQKDNARAARTPKAYACPANGRTKDVRQATWDNRDLIARYGNDAKAAEHRQALENDMDRTTHKKLDGDIAKAEQLYRDSEGKVADNATRDNLRKAIDHAKAVSKDPAAKN